MWKRCLKLQAMHTLPVMWDHSQMPPERSKFIQPFPYFGSNPLSPEGGGVGVRDCSMHSFWRVTWGEYNQFATEMTVKSTIPHEQRYPTPCCFPTKRSVWLSKGTVEEQSVIEQKKTASSLQRTAKKIHMPAASENHNRAFNPITPLPKIPY